MRTSNFFMGCALAVMALVVGCQSEEQVSENSVKEEVREDGFDEIAFMNKVKFKSLVDEHPNKRAPSATVNPKDLKFLNLVSVKLARKKLDCKSGFGLCDFKFFPKNTTVKVAEKAIFPGEYLVELKEDTLNSRYYMELLLDEEFPYGFDKNDACLIVDDDLYWVNDPVTVQDMEDLLNSDKMYEEMNRRIEYLFETGQIGAGNIPFIDSLGQHGGYVIEVVGKPVDRP